MDAVQENPVPKFLLKTPDAQSFAEQLLRCKAELAKEKSSIVKVNVHCDCDLMRENEILKQELARIKGESS